VLIFTSPRDAPTTLDLTLIEVDSRPTPLKVRTPSLTLVTELETSVAVQLSAPTPAASTIIKGSYGKVGWLWLNAIAQACIFFVDGRRIANADLRRLFVPARLPCVTPFSCRGSRRSLVLSD
jgi:hypothetical protein